MSDQNRVWDLIETIQGCNNAITIISELLYEFQVDSDTNNEIPSYIKSNASKAAYCLLFKQRLGHHKKRWNGCKRNVSVGVKNDS